MIAFFLRAVYCIRTLLQPFLKGWKEKARSLSSLSRKVDIIKFAINIDRLHSFQKFRCVCALGA